MAKYTIHDVDPDVWARADAKAKEAGWNMGDLLRQFLADYADGKLEPSSGPPRPRPHGAAPKKS